MKQKSKREIKSQNKNNTANKLGRSTTHLLRGPGWTRHVRSAQVTVTGEVVTRLGIAPEKYSSKKIS